MNLFRISDFVLRFFIFFSFALFLLIVVPHKSFAQTSGNHPASNPVNSFNSPNLDSNVPQNQHTFAQATTIEVISALICQISGIDPIDPSLGCLGINPQTRKIGLIKPQLDENGHPLVGGMLGMTTEMISMTYQQPATTGLYTEYLAKNFGIVKPAYAQEDSYGFNALRPILKLWETVRNIAYILLTLAFVLIGIGIMLRVKIDPRTVMSIQNQIPKVIISIILITFSYGIAALMVDLMWVTTYAGVNLISVSSPVQIPTDKGNTPLGEMASRNLLEIPLVYVNNVFHTGSAAKDNGGVFHITDKVSGGVSTMLRDIIRNLLGVDEGDKCIKIDKKLGFIPTPNINPGSCIASFFGWLASIVVVLIILVVLLVSLFRLWFQLIKAYLFTLVYIIVSPIYIVFGLLPTKPLGFEKWLRALFVNIAVFPLTAFLIVAARVLMDVYSPPNGTAADPNNFIPPLIGHNNGANFGALLAFGALLIAPSINTILKEKMGVKGIGSPGLVAAGIAGGAAIIGGPASRAMKHLNRHDSTGHAVGAMAVAKDKAGDWALNRASTSGLNPFKGATKRRIEERRAAKSGGYESVDWKRRQVKEAYRDKDHAFWKTAQGEEIIAKNHGEIPLGYRGRRNARNGEKEGGSGEGTSGESKGKRRLRDRLKGRMKGESGEGRIPFIGWGKSEEKLSGENPRKAFDMPRPEPKGSVSREAGTVTITAGHVTVSGKTDGEAKSGFIGKKADEYLDKLKKAGSKSATTKQNITLHLEDALENKGPEDIAQMHEADWERLFEDLENKEKH
ncbi:MAG TPA: hypothetical protein VNA13_00750 [Xanthomonadales bacterium]|nr:hypothetical protein [Xanthomonadales bacterium]